MSYQQEVVGGYIIFEAPCRYVQHGKNYLNCSISVQLVQRRDETADISLLSISVAVAEVERGFTERKNDEDVVARVTRVVDGSVVSESVDRYLIPYCRITVSSESASDLHAPEAAYTQRRSLNIISLTCRILKLQTLCSVAE